MLVVCLCPSSVHVVATFSGTVLFPLLCSIYVYIYIYACVGVCNEIIYRMYGERIKIGLYYFARTRNWHFM